LPLNIEDKMYIVDGDNMIINWKKLNQSHILTTEELNILYMLIDKIDTYGN
jgi:predicted RNA-binding protein with PIN domain